MNHSKKSSKCHQTLSRQQESTLATLIVEEAAARLSHGVRRGKRLIPPVSHIEPVF
jgi:hypothetical protein